ncbi:MAG: hypothetical protein ACRD07_10360 [Acidimicrobiales bacterium]
MSGAEQRDAREPEDLAALVGSRLTRYVDLWESASAKLSTGSYHADDLVDDWFHWLGMVSRDTAAAATLILGGLADAAGQGAAGQPDRPDAPEDEPGP